MERSKVKQFNQDVLKAVEKVYKSYGMQYNGSSTKYSDVSLELKLKFLINGENGESGDERLFKQYAFLYGVKDNDYGKTFTQGGRTFKLTGINPRAKKYPFVGQDVKTGSSYKFTRSAIVGNLK